MRKFYATVCLAMMAMTSFAQEQNDTTYVMMDFTQNPWNYPVREITKGWSPDTKDWDSPGALLDNTDFSWPVSEGSAEKIKITLYAVDIDESEKVSVLGLVDPESEAISLGVTAEKIVVLYTVPGANLRFEAPQGYKFGKMVFYCFHSPNFMVGEEYEEEFEYVYDNSTFKHKLKVWTPDSPKKNQYDYDTWEGDDTNILFNYPYFNANFVKIDMRLLSDGTVGITELKGDGCNEGRVYTLDGRSVNKSESLRKGIYMTNGKKYVVK
ncbi:MAG: hypothetical protein IKY01_09490 [Prevotella sp.]|nr:hypothetical protein [Prevotella sp.]